MSKVEANFFIINHLSRLFHMVTQNITQCSLQQMRGSMVTHNITAQHGMNACGYSFIHNQLALCDKSMVKEQFRLIFCGIRHIYQSAAVFQNTCVADLSSAFCIKRSLIQYDNDTVSFFRRRNTFSVFYNCQHFCCCF